MLRTRMIGSFVRLSSSLLLALVAAVRCTAQVDYDGDAHPWNQRADRGPDAEVPGWFYNLGLTGMRAQLVENEPTVLLIRHVFPQSPADGRIEAGDVIVGVDGHPFRTPHRDGYGEEVFGGDGPIAELAEALEACQSGTGTLSLEVRRGETTNRVELPIGTIYGSFSATYPIDCAKSDRILAELLEHLVADQRDDGSFGDPVRDTFAPLALLASGEERYLDAVRRNARFHARTTIAGETRLEDLPNWAYLSAAIVLSEFHLATGEAWVLDELREIRDFLIRGQFMRPDQINPRARQSHPDSFPRTPQDAIGGWGHNPGFEGYGPIQMITAQGAIALSLMHRCGIEVDRKRLDAAYRFIRRGTGPNGYVWYSDEPGGGADDWADMGRTGAAALANALSPYADQAYRDQALLHARVIGRHPQSFPDTHGSPPMGMAYTALGAHLDPESYRSLMDANRWWFTMAHCNDGRFFYQPNRDNAGYDGDARSVASSVVAFLMVIPKKNLAITGREFPEK
ncbi:MAG TPA: hypothetical protein DCQ98_14640 [Planctomycetaceae bacterium]|nr:hypothetical protein [Planctomycetaceae bacterium]HRF01307.1 DUF6288 domain-containing protein [Pirellulaceae bacterium]